ncbi:MAG: acetyl-CoA carboxylase, biotin carboxyl carrier protein, partial [Parasphingorhabdus sp.]
MPAKKETGEGMNVDIKLVRDLAAILEKAGLTEIEVEDGDRKIKVARGGGTFVSAPVSVAPAAAPAAAA